MRAVNTLNLSLNLYDKRNPASPGTDPGDLGDYTRRLISTWRSTTRGRGGYWLATAELIGSDWEKEEFFIDGLQREIVARVAGEKVWQGFISKMRLTRPNGEVYERDWTRIYNRVKAIYTRIGDNVLTNGSAESGAWADYNTPATNEQSISWVTDGLYSNHIVTNSANDGAIIETGLAIIAGKAYQIQVSVNIVSGDWFFEVYRTDTGESLAQMGQDSIGESVMSVSISSNNTYAGNVGIRLYTDDITPAEIYADNAIFQDAPFRAETRWYDDEVSQSEHGTRELVLLLAGFSDESAAAMCQTELRKRAWARSLPPVNYGARGGSDKTRLEITFSGYVFTLSSLHSLTTGTQYMDDIISAAVSEAPYISAGVIEQNNIYYQVDDLAPITLWDIIEDVTLAGDASGDRWECGVFSGLKLDYVEVPENHVYIWRGGQLLGLDNTPIEPWLVRPGYVNLADMPLGPENISGYETDDPRVVYMFEVEFNAPDWLAGGSGLMWSMEQYE